jgi:hypothetical protein
MGADELDHLPVAIRGGLPLPTRFEDHAESVISVVHVRISLEELARGLLGLIERACADKINHGVGVAGELILLTRGELTAEGELVEAVLVPGRFDGAGGGGRKR